jgi:hypothetical protein
MWYLVPLATLLALGYYTQPILIQPSSGSPSSSNANPALVLLGILARSTALPLFVVSATAPLLQSWFALTGHSRARDPYFLYAASNCGSLLALLGYPFVIEPSLGLTAQSRAWRIGFLVLAVLVLACGFTARRLSRSHPAAEETPETDIEPEATRLGADPIARAAPLAQRLWWLVLVFVPSSWLLGVTTYLTTDLASVPLLWTIPLALYLLSFAIAFARSGQVMVRIARRTLPYVVVPLVLVMSAGFGNVVWIPLHLLAFFTGSLACHGALAESRPPARLLSTFYVTIAVGGLLGGIANALIAPMLFSRVVEYPLAVVLACLVAPGIKARSKERTLRQRLGDLLLPLVVFLLVAFVATNQWGLADKVLGAIGVIIAAGLGAFACWKAHTRRLRFALTMAAVLAGTGLSQGVVGRLIYINRTFFGVLRVTVDSRQAAHLLFQSSTLHGQQSLDPALRREPSTYFTRSGPIGQLFEALEPRLSQPGSRVAIVGLGAGSLAAYARSGQRWTFYEIDPAVERVARDSQLFTYLQDCRADLLEVVLGDARLRLRQAPDHGFRLIMLDAFSSDAVPVHLLSREAIRLYRSKLADGGLLVFNLSNRYLDLDPLIGHQAEAAGLICRIRYDLEVSRKEMRAGKHPSIWAVIASTEADLGQLADDPRWRLPVRRPGSVVWTDDYSNVASYLMLTPRRLWTRVGQGRTPGMPGEP